MMDLTRFLIIKAMARAGGSWYATFDAVHTVARERPDQFDPEELHTFEEWEEIVGIRRRARAS